MTGVDVFIAVQNQRERRFFGTGTLREEYLAGKLHSIDKEETGDECGGNCGNGAVLCPLEQTPSPATGQSTSRVTAIVGRARSKRCLDMPTGCPVKKVPLDKPVPVVLNQDKDKLQKK